MVQVSSSGGKLVVSWDHDLSGGVDAYHVERRYATGLVDWATLTIVPATASTSYRILDEDDPGEGVQYRVNAHGTNGFSDWTESEFYGVEPEAEEPEEPAAPNAPTNVAAVIASMVRL